MADISDSGILKLRFPGYAWMPRWTRRYWTPSTALAIAVFLFSAGVWWGTYKTAPDVQGLRQSLAPILASLSTECVRGCLLKKEDITTLESHESDLWEQKENVDTEMRLKFKPIPGPQVTLPSSRHK